MPVVGGPSVRGLGDFCWIDVAEFWVGDWNVIGGLVVYWQWFGRGSVRYVGLVANIEMRSMLYVWLNGWLVRDLH